MSQKRLLRAVYETPIGRVFISVLVGGLVCERGSQMSQMARS